MIRHLKRELASLKGSSCGLVEMGTKLSNLEHRYQILNSEKCSEEQAARNKENQTDIEVCKLQDELRAVKAKCEKRENDVQEIKKHFFRLEEVVSAKEEEIEGTMKRLNSDCESNEQENSQRNELENKLNEVVLEAQRAYQKSQCLFEDIEKLKEQVNSNRRRGRDLKSLVLEKKGHLEEKKTEMNNLEGDLRNLGLVQSNKEWNLKKYSEKANVVENDIHVIDSETNKLQEACVAREELLKALRERRAELVRKETLCVREKQGVDSQLAECGREQNHLKAKLLDHETERLGLDHQMNGLTQLYERLANENRRLVEGLRTASERDERALTTIRRAEKIEGVIDTANKDIGMAMNILIS